MSPIFDLIHGAAEVVQNRAADRTQIRIVPGKSALVFDSPHSGTDYPADFDYVCDLQTLRRAEDTHVDSLFDFAPQLGIAWVEALFPRSYVDANRSDGDIDPTMIGDHWPGLLNSQPAALSKVRLGKGLIWKLTDEGIPIYNRPLSAAEVQQRIDRCWQPYHRAVADAIDNAHAQHGYSVHINCHSMPSVAGSHATDHPGLVHPDMVLGDRDGTTASTVLTGRLAEFLRAKGYSVSVNHPYKGVELVRRYSDPARQRHSIQLEINRSLYMDETTLQRLPISERLRLDLQDMAQWLLASQHRY